MKTTLMQIPRLAGGGGVDWNSVDDTSMQQTGQTISTVSQSLSSIPVVGSILGAIGGIVGAGVSAAGEKKLARQIKEQEYYLKNVRNSANTMATYNTLGGGIYQYKKGGWIQKAVSKMKKKGTVGTFSAAAKRAGMSTKAYANKIHANPGRYSPTLRKRANFARNVAKQQGGKIDNPGSIPNEFMPWDTIANPFGLDYLNGINNQVKYHNNTLTERNIRDLQKKGIIRSAYLPDVSPDTLYFSMVGDDAKLPDTDAAEAERKWVLDWLNSGYSTRRYIENTTPGDTKRGINDLTDSYGNVLNARVKDVRRITGQDSPVSVPTYVATETAYHSPYYNHIVNWKGRPDSYIHEFSHASNLGTKQSKLVNIALKANSLTEFPYEQKDLDYLRNPEEVYPRIMSIRYNAKLVPHTIITPEMIPQIRKDNPDEELLDIIDDNTLLMLLNGLASTGNKVKGVRKGGRIRRYQPGGLVEGDEEKKKYTPNRSYYINPVATQDVTNIPNPYANWQQQQAFLAKEEWNKKYGPRDTGTIDVSTKDIRNPNTFIPQVGMTVRQYESTYDNPFIAGAGLLGTAVSLPKMVKAIPNMYKAIKGRFLSTNNPFDIPDREFNRIQRLVSQMSGSNSQEEYSAAATELARMKRIRGMDTDRLTRVVDYARPPAPTYNVPAFQSGISADDIAQLEENFGILRQADASDDYDLIGTIGDLNNAIFDRYNVPGGVRHNIFYDFAFREQNGRSPYYQISDELANVIQNYRVPSNLSTRSIGLKTNALNRVARYNPALPYKYVNPNAPLRVQLSEAWQTGKLNPKFMYRNYLQKVLPYDNWGNSMFNMDAKEAFRQVNRVWDNMPPGGRFLESNMSSDSYPLALANLKRRYNQGQIKVFHDGSFVPLNDSGFKHAVSSPSSEAINFFNTKLDELASTTGKKIPHAKIINNRIYVPRIMAEKKGAPLATTLRRNEPLVDLSLLGGIGASGMGIGYLGTKELIARAEANQEAGTNIPIRNQVINPLGYGLPITMPDVNQTLSTPYIFKEVSLPKQEGGRITLSPPPVQLDMSKFKRTRGMSQKLINMGREEASRARKLKVYNDKFRGHSRTHYLAEYKPWDLILDEETLNTTYPERIGKSDDTFIKDAQMLQKKLPGRDITITPFYGLHDVSKVDSVLNTVAPGDTIVVGGHSGDMFGGIEVDLLGHMFKERITDKSDVCTLLGTCHGAGGYNMFGRLLPENESPAYVMGTKSGIPTVGTTEFWNGSIGGNSGVYDAIYGYKYHPISETATKNKATNQQTKTFPIPIINEYGYGGIINKKDMKKSIVALKCGGKTKRKRAGGGSIAMPSSVFSKGIGAMYPQIVSDASVTPVGLGLQVNKGVKGTDKINAVVGGIPVKLDESEILVKHPKTGEDIVISQDNGEATKYRRAIAGTYDLGAKRKITETFANRAIRKGETGYRLNDGGLTPSYLDPYIMKNSSWKYPTFGSFSMSYGTSGGPTIGGPTFRPSPGSPGYTPMTPPSLTYPSKIGIQPSTITPSGLQPTTPTTPTTTPPVVQAPGGTGAGTGTGNGDVKSGNQNAIPVAKTIGDLGLAAWSIYSSSKANKDIQKLKYPGFNYPTFSDVNIYANKPTLNQELMDIRRKYATDMGDMRYNLRDSNVQQALAHSMRGQQLELENKAYSQFGQSVNELENANTAMRNQFLQNKGLARMRHDESAYADKISKIQTSLGNTYSAIQTGQGFLNNLGMHNYQNMQLDAIANMYGLPKQQAGETLAQFAERIIRSIGLKKGGRITKRIGRY